MVVSPRHANKIYWQPPVVDKSKAMFLYCGFWQCRLASRRYGIRLLNLISHVIIASGRVKERLFGSTVVAEVGSNFFSFARTVPFSSACIVPTSCQVFFGICALLELILFYLYHFYFLIITISLFAPKLHQVFQFIVCT